MNYLFLKFLLLILIFLLIIYFYKSNYLETFVNSEISYIFWTGGYDSTFRICQALIDERRIVRPIYISDIIDNLPSKNNERRHSLKNEYLSMSKIRNKISKLFPWTRNRLLPLLDIKSVVVDNEIDYHMKILKKQKRVRRSICQYGAIAQVCKNLNKNRKNKIYIEISVEKEPGGSMMYNTIHNKVNCLNNLCYLKKNLSVNDRSLKIFQYLSFPTLNYTKRDMLDIAERGGYKDILYLTWSCWYPQNNKPCDRCIMCRERII